MASRILDIYIEEIRKVIKNPKSKKKIIYEYNYNLLGIEDNLDKSVKYKLMQKQLNEYLMEIKELFFKKNIRILRMDYEDYFKHFIMDSKLFVSEEEAEKINKASNLIVYQLYAKTIGVNSRKITFPIDINDVIELMIPTYIKKQYLINVVIRVIVNLAIIYNNLKNN